MSNALQEQPVRTRTRAQPPEGQDLPGVVVEYVVEHFGETISFDAPEQRHRVLAFVSEHFSAHALKEHRIMLMERLTYAGYEVPEVALALGKNEATVYRWRREMYDHWAGHYTRRDVRDIFVGRMRNIDAMCSEATKLVFQDGVPREDKIKALGAYAKLESMRDTVLSRSGYYEAFRMGRDLGGDGDTTRTTGQFVEDLEQAIMGEVEVVEEGEA